jgi:hypothetical protein
MNSNIQRSDFFLFSNKKLYFIILFFKNLQ